MKSRCFCWFPTAILVDHQYGVCDTKLYKVAWNVSANKSETVGHKDLRLGQIVYILVFYNISLSWFLPLDGFQFMLSLRDSENDLFSGSGYGLRAGVPFLSPSRAPKFPLPLPFLTPATQAIHSRKLSSTRRWAIDSDGVARLDEISSVVKVVLLAMCFWFLLSVLLDAVQREICGDFPPNRSGIYCCVTHCYGSKGIV